MAGVSRLSHAAIIAVGSELLTPSRLDTNSLFITEQLNRVGVEVRYKSIIGDDRGELSHAIARARERVDLVVCCGGLGPTDDDLTRVVVADLLGRPLHEDEAITARIRARFERRGLQMPEINRRQAMVPEGAVVLENTVGTAPGLWLDDGPRVVVLLPGPPRELQPMMSGLVDGRLLARCAGEPVVRRIIKLTGRSESHVDEAMQPLYAAWAAEAVPVQATILASLGQIELHLSTRAASIEAATTRLATAVDETLGAIGAYVYSVDGRGMEEVVGALLLERRATIAAAESCTGGLLLSRLTDVVGSSAYVDRGVVAYSNAAKVESLGVPAELIEQHGAVSEPVAAAMAEGIRTRSRATIGVGVTGIAGPGGGTEQKPVGTVAIAIATASDIRVRTFRFVGGRDMVKFQSSQAALDLVRRYLLGLDDGTTRLPRA
jgi:nicotinamide-nucleotide amidase